MRLLRLAALPSLLFLPVLAQAQYAPVWGFCVNGAVPALTSGLPSSNFNQSLIPFCTVTVYLTGTTTQATLFSDTHGTPLNNQFTASSDGSWQFYVSTSTATQGYDVTLSGGHSPNTYAKPRTLVGLFPATGGGGGGGVVVVPTPPSGSCTAGAQPQLVSDTGAMFSCQNGTWAEVGGSGAIINAGTPFQIAGYGETDNPSALYPFNIESDQMGNNLYLGLNGSTGSVTAGSLPGYRQNTIGAESTNRDGVLVITVRPQDMPGCAMSGLGQLDDAQCFNAAIQYLGSFDGNVQRRLVLPYTQYGYTFRNPGYMQILPADWGDYHGYAGFVNPAAVALYVVNGAVASCGVSGGSGYTANANLPVYIFDPSLRGSGGYATVQTNGSGTPTGCTVVQPGINYPPNDLVVAVFPLGGDGAAATATLTSGSFPTTQNPITPTAGGSGYASDGAASFPVGVGGSTTTLVCTTYPTFTGTVTGTAVTAVNVATAGAGCTYNGNASATVPLVFGASCGGAQCTLLPPETVNEMPCGVALINNLTIEGIGNPTINTEWNGTSADLAEMIAFCEPSGQQSTNITLRNFTLGTAFIGFYFPYVVNHLVMDSVTFMQNVAFPVHANSFSGDFGLASNITPYIGLQEPPTLPSVFTNIADYGDSGITCGGEWQGRTSAAYQRSWGPSSAGGYQNFLSGAFRYGGTISADLYNASHVNFGTTVAPCGNIRVDNFHYRPNAPATVADQTEDSTLLGGTIDAYWQAFELLTDSLDGFWEQYIWKTQNGPVTPFSSATMYLSSGLSSPMYNSGLGCLFTQSVTDRTVDYQFGNITAAPGYVTGYPFYQCFVPATLTPFVFMPRYSGTTVHVNPLISFSNISVQQFVNRPIIIGRFDRLDVSRVNIYGETALADPYRQTGQVVGAINLTARAVSAARIDGVTEVYGTTQYPSTYQNLVNGFPNNTGQYLSNVEGIKGLSVTVSGCALTSATGSSMAALAGATAGGHFSSGVSGTCAVVITPGITAPNGWWCKGNDLTTVADVLNQTTTSTVNCTISGTTVSGDSITWFAGQY